MKIYSKKGDDGNTSTLTGERISKNSPIMQVQGSIDELNAALGIVISLTKDENIRNILNNIQSDLFLVGTEITSYGKEESVRLKIPELKIEYLENIIDQIESKLEPLKNFVLPTGTELSANLHFSRTICRRAERDLVGFIENNNFQTFALKYINRLSDLLFVMARYANLLEGKKDTIWKL